MGKYEEPISELKTRISEECIGNTSFIHSVSTNQIRLLQRGGRQMVAIIKLKLFRIKCGR